MIIKSHEEVKVYEKDGKHFISVHNTVYSIIDLLRIDEASLSDELSKHASQLGFWSIMTGELEVLYTLEKINTEIIYAEYFRDFKSAGPKITDKLADSQVKTFVAYMDQKNYELDAFRVYNAVKSVMFGLRTKTDMLINLGANLRQEMNMTGMTIKDMKETLKSS